MNALNSLAAFALDHPEQFGVSVAGVPSFVWLLMATYVALKMAERTGQNNGAGVAMIAVFSTAIFMTVTGFSLYYIGRINLFIMLAVAVGLTGLMVIAFERITKRLDAHQ